jgi:hypothetical protein
MSETVNLEALKAMTVAQLEALKKSIADAEQAKKNEAKEEDLKTVKRLCRLHGFTASNLKGFLKTRKKSEKNPGEVAVKMSAKKAKEVVTA